MTIELGGPSESAKLIDWMWLHTMPADSWKGRKMALARIITPQGLLSAEVNSRFIKEVVRVLKAALGVGGEEDDNGIWTMLVEIDDGQWAVGAKIPTLVQFLDELDVSEQTRAEIID